MCPLILMTTIYTGTSQSLPYTIPSRLIKHQFIHIPKTGGTSIEDAAKTNGVFVGRFAKFTKIFPYERTPVIKCSAWHIPPISFVPGSWCVIRSPTHRLISEYLFQRKHKIHHAKQLHGRISSCEDIYKWTQSVKLDIDKECKNKTLCHIDNCHFINQKHYAKMCDVHIPFTSLSSIMNSLFNTSVHSQNTNTTTHTTLLESCNVDTLVKIIYNISINFM